MKKPFTLTILLLLLTVIVNGQNLDVSGNVTDAETGEALIGATVVVKGTTNGTVTDLDGNYRLTVEDPETTLEFSYIGYETVAIPLNGRTSVDVALNLDVSQLEEVVVVGYGTQKEKDLTSSITTVRSDEIIKTPTSQPMQALQGRVPGVQIVSNGAPGGAPTVRVRGIGSLQGQTAPLYVVDGMFFDNIDFLNTADIESISVLKDASAAAIYGVRAANGVVLIETKSGSYNQAPEIIYDGYFGVQRAQNVLKMANTQQFVQYVNETGDPADISFIDNAFQQYGRSRVNPNIPDVNTDWYNEVLRVAPIQNHSLSISGGNQSARYSIGGSYFAQEGLLQDTRNEYERLNFRAKVDFDASEWLNVGGNVNISNATQYNADNAVWFRTYFAVPVLPVMDEQNTAAEPYKLSNAQNLGYRSNQNPFYNLLYNDNRNQIGKILGNFFLDFDILQNNKLTFKTSYNYSYGVVNSRNVDFRYNDGQTQNLSAIRKGNSTSYNQIWDNILTYRETLGAHDITLMAGYSYRSETSTGLFARGTELDPPPTRENEELWYIPNAADKIDADNVGDSGSREFGVSYLGRIAYNYDGRYLLYGTIRRDGTNKFQEKWGLFPTVGAGWVASEENFFNVGFVNFLKVRASWGQLGNDGVASAIGAPTLSQVSTAINGTLVSGLTVENTFDFLDRWETTEETNFGITSTFLGGRLSVDADYYIRDTKNAVVTILLPLIRDNVRRNSGEIRNSGFEMAINWEESISDNLSYNIGGNFATLNNEVLSLGGPQYLDAGQAEFRQRSIVGEPFRAFYGYEVEGVFQNQEQIDNSGLTNEFIASNNLAPGDFNYRDQNGDGQINDQDRVVIGSFLPNLTYGFNFGVNYKQLNLTANFQGQAGHDILNRKRGEVIFTTDTNIDADLADNLWRGEGTSNIYPSAAGIRRGYNQAMSEYFVEKGDYFRIQNVRFSYLFLGGNLPEARVTLTAERPLTVFDYNGFNPEVADGIDRQVYPIPAVYTLGLNLKF